MGLRGRILLVACTTVVLCGVGGSRLLSWRAGVQALEGLDRELKTGEIALERQLELRRGEMRGALRAIAKQTYFRAYFLAGDRAQMGYFAAGATGAGADAVAIVDARGRSLAVHGELGPALAQRAEQGSPAQLGGIVEE